MPHQQLTLLFYTSISTLQSVKHPNIQSLDVGCHLPKTRSYQKYTYWVEGEVFSKWYSGYNILPPFLPGFPTTNRSEPTLFPAAAPHFTPREAFILSSHFSPVGFIEACCIWGLLCSLTKVGLLITERLPHFLICPPRG